MKTLTSTVSLLFLFVQLVNAQIAGLVSDKEGVPLPFASVYVQGTTNGTTTNIDGAYFLSLEPGKYALVFQYIGYGQKIEHVDYTGTPLKMNIQLLPESISLNEIEIKANAEDPAYAIIRKAIAKRKFYKEQVNSYTCDVYIKGSVKILDAPEKVLGQDVGDIDGSLDSNRQGMVYLSESVSKLYYLQPDRYKEVMSSSKVSGNDNGFSFNSAQEMNMDLYNNYVHYGRNVISPIADGALSYYKFRLEGVLVNEEGRLINKIELLPKRSEDPVYQGYIYIVDESWNIERTDIFLTGNRVQMPLFDTLHIRQMHVPVAEPNVWRLLSQTYNFVGGAFGFRFGGDFTGIYTNYDLSPDIAEKFFGNEIMKVTEGANEKDSIYWEAVRPVPLTVEESTDYRKKDSIKVVLQSKPYLDSVDQVNNKLKFNALLFGYTYANSWKKRSWKISSPLNTFGFNAVQGGVLNLNLGYTQSFDELNDKKITVGTKVNYGFAEDKWRAMARFSYNYNPKTFGRFRFYIGQELTQFYELEPISPLLNTSYSLFSKENYARFYDKKYIKADHLSEISNGIMLYSMIQYASRSPLVNHSEYSWFNRSKLYEPNTPENAHLSDGILEQSDALTAGVSLRFRVGQKYYNYPDRKYIYGSKYPDLWIHYRKGIRLSDGLASEVNYDQISAIVQKRNIKAGMTGLLSFRLGAGIFVNRKKAFFQDFKHFLGNELIVGNSERYLYAFKRLPYYAHSTDEHWLEGHWEHQFQGLFLDRIPLVKRLGWGLVAGANFLYTPEEKDYMEYSIGINQIGFGPLKLFRFDVVGSFKQGEYDGLGYLIGVLLPLDDLEL